MPLMKKNVLSSCQALILVVSCFSTLQLTAQLIGAELQPLLVQLRKIPGLLAQNLGKP